MSAITVLANDFLRQHFVQVFSILFGKNINIYFLTVFLTTTSNVVLIPAVTASKAFEVQRKFSFNLMNPSQQFSPDVSRFACALFHQSYKSDLSDLVNNFVYGHWLCVQNISGFIKCCCINCIGLTAAYFELTRKKTIGLKTGTSLTMREMKLLLQN